MSGFVERLDAVLIRQQLKRAALCEAVGITIGSLTAWNKRGTIPSGDVCLKIADFLKVDLRWLISGEEKETELSPEEKDLLSGWSELSDSDKEEIKMLLDFKNKAAKKKNLSADLTG